MGQKIIAYKFLRNFKVLFIYEGHIYLKDIGYDPY